MVTYPDRTSHASLLRILTDSGIRLVKTEGQTRDDIAVLAPHVLAAVFLPLI